MGHLAVRFSSSLFPIGVDGQARLGGSQDGTAGLTPGAVDALLSGVLLSRCHLEDRMSVRIKWIALMIVLIGRAAPSNAQGLPLLNMGYSGAGIGADLLKVV